MNTQLRLFLSFAALFCFSLSAHSAVPEYLAKARILRRDQVLFYGKWNRFWQPEMHFYNRRGQAYPSGYLLVPESIRHQLPIGFCADRMIEGLAKVHHVEGWTVLGLWDRSADPRDGSSSTFLIEGNYEPLEVIDIFKDQFPEIWKRFEFEVQIQANLGPSS